MEGFRGRIVERGRQRGEWTVGERGFGLGSGSEEEVKPIVFTDHTGTEDKTRIVGAGINPITVDRNAVGFEVGVWAA